jgi:tetratricopeptide (TPR) repeat protein
MTPAGTRWGATGAVVVLVVICLAAVDQFLARVESAEMTSSAQRSYSTGSRQLAEGNFGEAIDSLRNAHALDRQNPEYELQLIAALTAAGKTADAEPLLTDILQRKPNDARANLTAARLMIREGNTGEAEAYYHRAIYGAWSGDGSPQSAAHRVSTRLELIDLLARKNQKQELLAELISLQAETPANAEIQKRLGKLFLLAGAPARAADVYEALAGKDPTDTAAYEGMGEAELEQGHYAAAHAAFFRAASRDPGNESVRAHLQTLDTVAELDPTARQLTSAEKYSRSIRILDMARTALDQCVDSHPADETSQLLKGAEATIAAQAPAHITNEIAEGVLSLAEKLWRADRVACADRSSGEKPGDRTVLDLIMNKLAS